MKQLPQPIDLYAAVRMALSIAAAAIIGALRLGDSVGI